MLYPVAGPGSGWADGILWDRIYINKLDMLYHWSCMEMYPWLLHSGPFRKMNSDNNVYSTLTL